MEAIAIEIIRSSESYSQAYARMIDADIPDEDAAVFWDQYQNECGADLEN